MLLYDATTYEHETKTSRMSIESLTSVQYAMYSYINNHVKSFRNFRCHFLKINFQYNVRILTSTATCSSGEGDCISGACNSSQMELCQTLWAVHGIPQCTSSLSHTHHTHCWAPWASEDTHLHLRAHAHMYVSTPICSIYEQDDLRTYIGVYKYS